MIGRNDKPNTLHPAKPIIDDDEVLNSTKDLTDVKCHLSMLLTTSQFLFWIIKKGEYVKFP